MHSKKKLFTKGQSLVEAVVAIAVVVLIVSGLIIAVISSLRSAQSSRARSTATKLTQDGIEIVRNLRDLGWTDFISKDSSVAWCLGNDKELSNLPVDCVNNIPADSVNKIPFTRTALITETSPNQATVTIEVTWLEGQTPRKSTVTTYLTQWR
jgi:type II secretory pathway pseudopilin PulG